MAVAEASTHRGVVAVTRHVTVAVVHRRIVVVVAVAHGGTVSIVIPVASLDSMRNKFTTWKGPTE